MNNSITIVNDEGTVLAQVPIDYAPTPGADLQLKHVGIAAAPLASGRDHDHYYKIRNANEES